MPYNEPICLKQCKFTTVDGVESCESCGRVLKKYNQNKVSVSDKYKGQDPLFSEEELNKLKEKNKTEDIRMKYFIEDNKDLIEREIKSGLLSKEKVDKYGKNTKKD